MATNHVTKNGLTKGSLLSASLFVVSGGAIAGNIPTIATSYPEVNKVLIELITTIPSLFIVLTVAFSYKIAKKIGYKQTVSLGLLFVGLSSLAPLLTNSFTLFFISRMVFGIGIGLFNPLLYRFSSEIYSNNQLSTMIGLQSTFEGIGGMLLTFLVGQLLKIDWQVSFLAYALAFLVLILFNKYVPDIKKEEIIQQKSLDKSIKQSKNILLSILLLVVVVTIYMSVTIKITRLLIEKGIGNATDGSNMIALVGLGAMLAGICFGGLLEKFREWVVILSFTGLAISMLGFYESSQLLFMGIYSILCGFSFRLFIPYLFNLFNQIGHDESEKSTSLLLIGFNIAVALAPISLSVLESSLSIKDESTLFLVEFYILICLILVITSIKLVSLKKRKED